MKIHIRRVRRHLACPECGEPARRCPPRQWVTAAGPRSRWSHPDGEPLCPVVGPAGYRPADARPVRRPRSRYPPRQTPTVGRRRRVWSRWTPRAVPTGDRHRPWGRPTPDLPPGLAARPRDARRGLPIPPVNVHANTGSGGRHVDFTTINTIVSTRLAVERRCSLCGEPTKSLVAFIGTRAVQPTRASVAARHSYAATPTRPAVRSAWSRSRCAYTLPSPGTGAPKPTGRARASCRPARTATNPPGAGWASRTCRSMYLPEHGFTVYLPAPFRTVRAYVYGPDGRLHPGPGTR
ncbi:hypothetical protein EV385_0528 [Krasilnikovia cinnamomea]|uniref:Uncharacterized protein n=1 Tax=Krasilnikovia cinnamomea TaxID=349313 RepID=A0A4Q7ZET7_9ACTN|nr:hypothetical protein EV385_0528 [Krasilnikovia cinnamomea]